MAASGRGGRVRDLFFFLFVVFIFVGLGWEGGGGGARVIVAVGIRWMDITARQATPWKLEKAKGP